jgi:hypothetical protein
VSLSCARPQAPDPEKVPGSGPQPAGNALPGDARGLGKLGKAPGPSWRRKYTKSGRWEGPDWVYIGRPGQMFHIFVQYSKTAPPVG